MGAYQENPEHVPDPTAVVAQLETTGLGRGNDTVKHVAPGVFSVDAERANATAYQTPRDENVVVQPTQYFVPTPESEYGKRLYQTAPAASGVGLVPDAEGGVALGGGGKLEPAEEPVATLGSGDRAQVGDGLNSGGTRAVAADEADPYAPLLSRTVPMVKAHMDESDAAEVERVKAAERAGQGRKGILEYEPAEGE